MDNAAREFDPRLHSELQPETELRLLGPVTVAEDDLGVALAGVVTDIKIGFRGIEWKQAYERTLAKARLERESLYQIFQRLGMLSEAVLSTELRRQYDDCYDAAAFKASEMGDEEMMHLFDKFEDHPCLRVFEMLRQVSSNLGDSNVKMQRIALVLLEQNS